MKDSKTGKSDSSDRIAEISGRDRVTRNVLISWAGQFVFVIFGFVLPRLIDDNLGQVSLGVWDFAWAIVSYMNFAMLGIGSAVNNFVASHRAAGEVSRLNQVVSSVFVIQVGIALLVAGMTFYIYKNLPAWFPDRVGEQQEEIQYVLLMLGISLSIQMSLDSYRGVMTGCHRWDVHYILNSTQYFCSASTMLILLVTGHGLREIAQAYLIVSALFELARIVLAHRVCPELKTQLRLANWADMRKVTRFGVKNLMLGIGPLIVLQTISIMVVTSLGPATLAIMVRPIALLKHIEAFVIKIGHVVSPTISSLTRLGDQRQLRKFALRMARVGWALGIPPVVFMLVYGSDVITIWMGADYAATTVIEIVSVAYLFTVANSPSVRILIGLNRHGGVAKTSMIMYALILLVGIPVIGLGGWSLIKAVSLLAVSRFLFGVVIVPYYVGKALNMGPMNFLYRTAGAVVSVGGICFVVLNVVRNWQESSLAVELMTGMGVLLGLLIILYWLFVIPQDMRNDIKTRLRISLA